MREGLNINQFVLTDSWIPKNSRATYKKGIGKTSTFQTMDACQTHIHKYMKNYEILS